MITDFSAGLVDNVAYNHRGRIPPAAIAENCRVNNQGWLVPRKGRVAVPEMPEPSLPTPEYPEVENIAIVYESITYRNGEPLTLQDIDLVFQSVVVDESELEQELPDVQGNTDDPLPVLSPKTLVGEHSEPMTVETLQVLESESDTGEFQQGTRANVHTLKVLSDGNHGINLLFRIVADTTLTIQVVKAESLEIVRSLRSERTYLDGGEVDREPNQNEGPRRKQIHFDGKDDYGVTLPAGEYYVAFTERRPIIPNPATDPITEYSYHYSYLGFTLEAIQINITAEATATANFIDVYGTLPGRAGYYWMARMRSGETITYQFPFRDDITPQVLTFETPTVVYRAKNDLRTYAAEVGSDKVYVSHFDPGTGERLLHNYTGIIPLELDGGFITGLAFTRDRQLVVYCSNQIHVITTDALFELHQVFDFIQPSDDKGEKIGTVAPGSIVDMGGMQYFLATNRRIYVFDALRVVHVSDKIDGLLAPRRLTLSGDTLNLETVVAFSYDKHYMISMTDKQTLVYDTEHSVWWQDTFGVTEAIRDAAGNLYGRVNGQPCRLYEGDTDNGAQIQRRFKSNPYSQHAHSQWDSVHVYTMGGATLDVTCYTEQGSARDVIEIEDAGDWWGQRLGVNLQGRYYEVEIVTESDVPIDRIMVNERMRKRRGR